jgi:N-formylglutamate amidohydrolase
MFSRLPIIVSVPHDGKIIAPESHDRTLLTREDIFSDGDPLTVRFVILRKMSRDQNLFCGLDCHTMLDRAPIIDKLPGGKRPFICLSNREDRNGNRVKGRRLTCSPEMISSLDPDRIEPTHLSIRGMV